MNDEERDTSTDADADPTIAREEYVPASPAARYQQESWNDTLAYGEPMKMSALDFVTCATCNTTYIKGDDHSCG